MTRLLLTLALLLSASAAEAQEYRYAVETRNTDPAWFQRFVYGHRAPGDVVPGLSDTATDLQVRVVCAQAVDPRLHRWNGTANTACTRAATAPEIAAYDAERVAKQADRVISRDKNLLATLAVVIRGRNISAWNALTMNQKVQAVKDEAAVWKTMREFLDDKF